MKKAAKDEGTALDAKFAAQRIAFAPIVFQATLALRDLGILDTLSSSHGPGKSLEELTSELTLPPYGIQVLLDAGLGAEIVAIDEEKKYRLTKTGYFLANDKLTNVNMNFVADVCYQAMYHLKDALVEGKPAGLKALGPWNTIYEGLTHLPAKAADSWFAFDHFYSDSAFAELLPIVFSRQPTNLLDIGGNTGRWAIKCFEYDPSVEITIIDLPDQLAEAVKNITAAGFQDRLSTKALDILEQDNELVDGADCIVMSQFLDCFSADEITRILTRTRQHMNETTSLFILELFWDLQPLSAWSIPPSILAALPTATVKSTIRRNLNTAQTRPALYYSIKPMILG
jgi:hypothetical protein